ncbi:MAG: GvpL/GvpF family gas vesicle protein [Parcubacteria group bacterium]|nr:GvpL/GvpF family gas vesicle protein [Parcubacteria group bacterium]
MKEPKYIYCILNKTIKSNFGEIGINENKVYSLPYKEFSIIVNDCSVKEIKDKKEIDLAIEHQYVIDKIMKRFNVLIPFNEGTLINGDKIKNWIDKNHQNLIDIFKKIKDKQEFGIQIFYNTKIKKQELTGKVKDYIDKQKKLRKELTTKINKYKEEFHKQIDELVDGIKIREVKKSLDEKQMLLDISCLVHKDKVKLLKNRLKEINNMKDFSVNFNGPWAPYSFAN